MNLYLKAILFGLTMGLIIYIFANKDKADDRIKIIGAKVLLAVVAVIIFILYGIWEIFVTIFVLSIITKITS